MSLEPAFVLSRRAYSNTSLLIELFTAGSGRFAVIARGARSRAGRQGGHLQPFVPLEAGWGGRGEVKTLHQAEATGLPLLQHGEVLFFGYYLNELLLRLVPRQDPCAQIFAHYRQGLEALALGAGEACLRRFEVQLLESLGYALSLDHTLDGDPVCPDGRYLYLLGEGVTPAQGGDSAGVTGETLLALAGNRGLDEAVLLEARPFMRQVMRHYLGGQPLKSRELFRAMRIGKRKE